MHMSKVAVVVVRCPVGGSPPLGSQGVEIDRMPDSRAPRKVPNELENTMPSLLAYRMTAALSAPYINATVIPAGPRVVSVRVASHPWEAIFDQGYDTSYVRAPPKVGGAQAAVTHCFNWRTWRNGKVELR